MAAAGWAGMPARGLLLPRPRRERLRHGRLRQDFGRRPEDDFGLPVTAGLDVYIFSKLGLEPWGRIGSGVVELAASVLLLVPGTVTLGALLALGVIAGAIVSHLTRLEIVVMDDGGLLFVLALAVFAGSAAILVLRRREIPIVGDRF